MLVDGVAKAFLFQFQKSRVLDVPLRLVFEAIDFLIYAIHKAGVEEAVICPGSRNAPVTISIVRSGLFKNHSVADERSAGFIALGKAIRMQKPVLLLCTSGSALSNFYPAIVEAFYQRVPLIVLSADRPADLLDRWDGQTIQQEGLYGKHVKGSFNTSEDYSNPKTFLELAQEAMNLSLSEVKGPVHINIPLAEPLYPEADRAFVSPLNDEWQLPIPEVGISHVPKLNGKRVLVIRGFDNRRQNYQPSYSAQYSDLMSRFSNSPLPDQIFAHRDKQIIEALKPEVLLSDGAAVLSKALKLFLRSTEIQEHYHFSLGGDIADPFFTNPQLVKADLDQFIIDESQNWNQEYINVCASISSQFKQAESDFWKRDFSWNEFTSTKKIIEGMDEKSILHLSNSMPVRYASLVGANVNKTYCNRGTSGIDGCVSTALGMASSDSENHYLLVGDIAFFYDSNALWNNLTKRNFKIILQNNGGGGIFRLLDGPSKQPELEIFFETSHSREARELCMNLNCHYFRAENEEQLNLNLRLLKEIEGPALLEIFTNKLENQSFFNQYKEKINAVKISLGNHS